ncbi:MAG: DUF192 domain-containing protein [Cyanobacteria bacterium J06554_6]
MSFVKLNLSRVAGGWRFAFMAACLLLLSCSSTSSEAIDSGPSPAADAPLLEPSPSVTVENPTVENPTDPLSSFGPGQLLPVTAEATLAGTIIRLEVAETRQQQALGLMYRTELADDRGMLFPFEFARRASFWMKNVPISLDMIFLLDGQVQAIAENVPPCAADPCPTYGPGALLVDQVIELRGGRAAEIGLQPGDTVEIRAVEIRTVE